MRRKLRSNIGITPLRVAVTKHSPPVCQSAADNIALTLLSNVDAKIEIEGIVFAIAKILVVNQLIE